MRHDFTLLTVSILLLNIANAAQICPEGSDWVESEHRCLTRKLLPDNYNNLKDQVANIFLNTNPKAQTVGSSYNQQQQPYPQSSYTQTYPVNQPTF
jgi:hypothetical protein